MRPVIFSLYHLKGDALFYRPDGVLGWLIAKFAGDFSHTSRAYQKARGDGSWLEIDAAIEQDGFGLSPVEWKRKPVIVPLPHDDEADKLTRVRYEGEKYAKLQVFTQGIVILTGKKVFLNRSGVQCAEAMGVYLGWHWLYREALMQGRIPRKLRLKMEDPDTLTPKDIYRVAVILAKTSGRKPIKKYKVQKRPLSA